MQPIMPEIIVRPSCWNNDVVSAQTAGFSRNGANANCTRRIFIADNLVASSPGVCGCNDQLQPARRSPELFVLADMGMIIGKSSNDGKRLFVPHQIAPLEIRRRTFAEQTLID